MLMMVMMIVLILLVVLMRMMAMEEMVVVVTIMMVIMMTMMIIIIIPKAEPVMLHKMLVPEEEACHLDYIVIFVPSVFIYRSASTMEHASSSTKDSRKSATLPSHVKKQPSVDSEEEPRLTPSQIRARLAVLYIKLPL